MMLPTVKGAQAAHAPGAGGALAPTHDTEPAPLIQGEAGPDLLPAGLKSGAGALKGALGPKVPGPVNITPSVGGAFDSSRAPSDFSNAGSVTDAANKASFGALGNGFQPQPLDVTSGLAAMSQKNPLTPMEHDPSWMEKIGGALGLRKAGPSTSGGGAFDGLFDDPDRVALLETGLGTMAAAGQPGATLGGALGQGGLGAVRARDIRKERDDKTKEAQIRLDTETARYNADRQERAAFHGDENRHWNDTNTRETNRDKATAAQNLVLNSMESQRIKAGADAEAAREKDSAALRGIEGRNADTAARNATSNDANRLSEEEDRKSKRFNDAFRNAQGKSVNPLTGLLQSDDPSKAPPTTQEAQWMAAKTVPDASEAKQVAQQRLSRIDQNYQNAISGGGDPKKADTLRNRQRDEVFSAFPQLKPKSRK